MHRALQFVVLLLASTRLWSAIGIDANVSADGSGSTITSPAFSTLLPNQLLLAFIATDANSSGIRVSAVTGAGLNWALVQRTNAQLGTAEIWRAFAPSTLSRVTVNARLSQRVAASITILTFAGVDNSGTNGSGAIGATASANAGSGAPTATLITTRNYSWVFGVGTDWDRAVARTVGPNQTLVHQSMPSVGNTYWVQQQNAPTPFSGTSVSISDTAPTTDRYNLSIVEILPALSSGLAYGVSGTIAGAGGSGATVALTGTSNATVTADASGNYSFRGLANGSYTVTPSKAGFAFAPSSQNASVNNNSVTAVNFTTATYSISGTIAGAGGSGASVTLTGTSNATVTADASGNYTFSGLANGSYTVTPSKAGFAFAPSSQNVSVSSNSVTAVNFTTATYSISGTIAGAGGSGATVVLTGTSNATVTADASGNYSFSGLANGSYTVTPSKAGFTFAPSSQNVSVNNNSVTAVNFTTATYSISGTITGAGGSGATVALTGASNATVTADTSGNYSFGGLVNGSYAVTPSKAGFAFAPSSQNVSVTNNSVTAVNFTTATYSISGTITGAGGSGAMVTLTGTSNATVTADASGNYTFTGLANGTYTVTPSKSGFTFTPASTNVTVNGANQTANFTASSQTWTIQGTISGGSGATVNLSQGSTIITTVTADAGGNYTLSSVVNGTYTVTPSNAGYVFTPSSQAVTVSGANLTGINFTASQTWSIQGNISPSSSGTGAAVTLAQGATTIATATADSNGNYTLNGVVNGTYTVTPTKSGYTCTPLSQGVTVNGASVTGINFTASALPTYGISGMISPSANGSGATVTLSGTASATTTADASGAFSFSGLANGSYTVTPTKTGFTISPASEPVSVNNASVTGVNFTAALGLGIDVVTYGDTNSASTTAVTSAFSTTGYSELLLAFIATDASSSGITVTGVSGGGLSWVPVRRTNTQLGTAEVWRALAPSPLSNVSVTGTLSQRAASSISVVGFSGADSSGISGSGAIGATVSASAGSGAPTATLVTTRNNSWVIGVGNDWDKAIARTVGPNQTLVHQFMPTVGDTYWVQRQSGPTALSGTTVTINDTAPTSDRYNLTIVEVLPGTAGGGVTYGISGTLSPAAQGSGATVTLSGTASGTTTADSSGNYAFSGIPNGSCTVTPSKSGYSFSPASQSATINGASVANLNFTVSANSPPPVVISISPTSATVITGGTQQFTATLQNTSNTAVTWQVNGGTGGNATTGRISSSGLYTGPGTVPNPATVTVTAVSQADPSKSASALVTVVTQAPVNVTISPTSATVPTGGTQQFTATVQNTSNTAVTWSATGGAVSPSGLYTAPNSAGTYSVTATSVADSSKTAFSVVTVSSAGACGNTMNWTSSTCQTIASGALNTAQVNGVNDPNAWTVISRHGEYAQNETECNIPGAISVVGGNLIITTSASAYTCGDWTAVGAARTTPSSFPYSTGAIQWNTFSFLYGTVIIRAAIPSQNTGVWPAFWFLPSFCQTSNKYSGDTQSDGTTPAVGGTCIDSGSTGYQEIDLMEAYSYSTWPQIAFFNPSTHNCLLSQSPLDIDYHIYAMSWTASGLSMTLDGASTGCSWSSDTPTGNPMFLIIQTQTSNATGPPNNSYLPTQLSVDYVKVCSTNYTAAQCSSAAVNDPNVIFYDDFTSAGLAPTQ